MILLFKRSKNPIVTSSDGSICNFVFKVTGNANESEMHSFIDEPSKQNIYAAMPAQSAVGQDSVVYSAFANSNAGENKEEKERKKLIFFFFFFKDGGEKPVYSSGPDNFQQQSEAIVYSALE